ncbi:MAG: hypothetical protein AB2A00_35510 [Myxococcota bacterium]
MPAFTVMLASSLMSVAWGAPQVQAPPVPDESPPTIRPWRGEVPPDDDVTETGEPSGPSGRAAPQAEGSGGPSLPPPIPVEDDERGEYTRRVRAQLLDAQQTLDEIRFTVEQGRDPNREALLRDVARAQRVHRNAMAELLALEATTRNWDTQRADVDHALRMMAAELASLQERLSP